MFSSAIYEDYFEGRHFARALLILGIIGSILGSFIAVSGGLIGAYVIIALVLSVVFFTRPFPVLTALVASGSALLIPGVAKYPVVSSIVSFTGGLPAPVPATSLIAFVGLVIILNVLFIKISFGNYSSPVLSRNKRNNLVAKYRLEESTVVPLLLMMPGDWFTSHLAFWPVFSYGGHTYTFVFLPLVLGLRATIQHSDPKAFTRRLSNAQLIIGVVALTLAVAGKYLPKFAGYGLIVVAIGYLITLVALKHQDKQNPFEYTQVMDGVRVLGIKPATPAAKMNLNIGDVILTVNGLDVTNETELYQGLSRDSTYVKMRVRDRNDQLKITETAIFKNSPHEIGIKTYTD